MNDARFRYTIGLIALIGNILLLVIPLFFLICTPVSFYPNELPQIFQIILPIKALYISAIIKYIITYKNELKVKQNKYLNLFYTTITSILIISHIVIVGFLIIMTGLGNILFDDFRFYLMLVESFFGVYIGAIITDLFRIVKK